ncbi:MAG: hypothetical protein BAA01_04685 [Bacillus thermozeamaize]|uniref:Uncharacterized protein n=1 Tax=Bacillus thermozeamaize TaxID=230954 RepID=A0A1Y3PDT4_9BACI|nr:MAG: hypothetical protein BAA01_04685 [Bacillus thermozeamaize]
MHESVACPPKSDKIINLEDYLDDAGKFEGDNLAFHFLNFIITILLLLIVFLFFIGCLYFLGKFLRWIIHK